MLDGIIRNLTAKPLRGGMFTTAMYLLMVLAIITGVVCLAVRNIWEVVAALMAALFCLVFYMIYRLFNFADKNPLVAILQGSDYVRLEETRQASKTQPEIPLSPPTIDHEPPNLGEDEILTPDAPSQIEEDVGKSLPGKRD